MPKRRQALTGARDSGEQLVSEQNYPHLALFVHWLMEAAWGGGDGALIKNKIKFSSYIRKFRVEQLNAKSYIYDFASSYMGKYLRISSYIRKPFLIYDFATVPL